MTKTKRPAPNLSTTTHGGKLDDIPKPHVRFFPRRGVKRKVEVTITSWVGVSAGAAHYTPRIEEERNPLWNGESWQYAWDDLEGKGTEMQGPKFRSEKAAREWVQWALRAFDPKKYEFVYTSSMLESKPKWFYAREGD